MRARPVVWFRLRFPSVVDPDALQTLLQALHGSSTPSRRDVWVFRVVAREQEIEHYLAGPPELAGLLQRQARGALPGLVLEPSAPPTLPAARLSWRVWQSTARRPLRTDVPVETARTLLHGLSGTGSGELVCLTWVLGPVIRPRSVATKHAGMLGDSWARSLAVAPWLPPAELDSDARRGLRDKHRYGGWRAAGRIAVTATERAHALALLGRVGGAIRTVQAPGVSLGVKPLPRAGGFSLRLPLRGTLHVSVPELVGLVAWPLGPDVGDVPVARRRARLLPAPRRVPTAGRVLAADPVRGRSLALSASDSRGHLLAIGPTGVGKSTLLTRLVAQDMAAGRSVVVLDVKGDLITDCLGLVPAGREQDVVVLDPTDTAPVGLNPLQGSRPELVADQILTMLAALNASSWGPRLAEVLNAGLVTLARTPGMSLPTLPLLLTNQRFRARLVRQLNDPLGVSPVWAAFEAMSEEAQAQAVSAVLNKIRPLVGRSDLRAVLGQAEPTFALTDLLTSRKILLVDLAKGRTGPDAARLLGTLLLNQLWQTILSRSTIPPPKRHLISVVVDEFQDVAGIASDFGDVLAQARGLGVAFTLAHQHLGQLTDSLQDSVLANARSRVVFQTGSRDAAVLARGHGEIRPEDFTQLPAYEAYLRLLVGNEVTPYFSGRTLPPAEPVNDPARLRRLSRERYGQDRRVTDDALAALVDGRREGSRPVIGSRRRQP